MGTLLEDGIKIQHLQGADAVLRGAIISSSSYGNENSGRCKIHHYTNLLCWVLLKLSVHGHVLSVLWTVYDHVALITYSLMACENNRVHYGPMVVPVCLHMTLPHYIWHCVPNILLWSILCKTVGLPSSTGESERTARRQFHSPTLRCFRGRLCEVAAGRGPLKQSRWPESNWTLPLRSVGVAPSLGRFWLVFTALKLRYVLRRHIILSDSDGNQGVLDCFTVYPGLGGSVK